MTRPTPPEAGFFGAVDIVAASCAALRLGLDRVVEHEGVGKCCFRNATSVESIQK